MMMEQHSKRNDLLVERLSEIFAALYQGSEISKNWLCQRFHITERTAYRDLARLANILDEISPGRYRLSRTLTPQLSAHDLNKFASFSDVVHLFPNADGRQLREFMEDESHITIRGHSSRDNSILATTLQQLRDAITKRVQIDYLYKGKPRQAAPYRLTNQSGLWYLTAVEQGQLKSFELGQIESLIISDMPFYPEPAVLEQLANNSGISFGKKTQVILHVSEKIAPFIARRTMFYEQKCIESKTDGSLIISTVITEDDHLFRWLRYWLPEISIISPCQLAHRFSDDLFARTKSRRKNV